jgi:hypothetical protein
VKNLGFAHSLQPIAPSEMAQEENLKLLLGVKRFELSGIGAERKTSQLSVERAPIGTYKIAKHGVASMHGTDPFSRSRRDRIPRIRIRNSRLAD